MIKIASKSLKGEESKNPAESGWNIFLKKKKKAYISCKIKVNSSNFVKQWVDVGIITQRLGLNVLIIMDIWCARLNIIAK